MSKIESNGISSPPIENQRKPFVTSELRDTSQEMKERIEQLEAEVEHLERTKAEWRNTAYQFDMKLAACQAREQQLLEVLYACEDMFDIDVGSSNLHRKLTVLDIKKVLATPPDTTALEAMIAKAGEVMREWCLEAGVMRNYKGAIVSRLSADGRDNAIRAIPTVTLNDLK